MTKLIQYVTALSFVGLLSGCEQPANPGPPNPPSASNGHNVQSSDETFESAAQELVTLRNTIRDGFAANDIDAAHGPLHDVGHVLEELPGLAEKNGVTGNELESVKTSTNALFDAFGAVDKTLHGGEGSTYAEETFKIDTNIKIIADLAGIEAGATTTKSGSATTVEPPDSIEPVDALQPIDSLEPIDATEPVAAPAPKSPASE